MAPVDMPPPKFATKRDHRYPTRGRGQAAFADIWLGQGFMPWQREVADVSGEYDPDTGLPVHSLIVGTVQRQAGKSHLEMAQNGELAFRKPGARCWYTAQTGADARDQFLKFQDDVVEGTPLDRVVRTLRGNGHEVMKFPNTSTIRPHPPGKKALHGKQSDRNGIDEGWAFTSEDGQALLQGIGPTQLTRPGAQTFIWSAGGTADSTWLAELVARGRAGDPSVCYFEWGIPDDLPLDDLDAIAEYHPAYGHTITVDGIRKLRTLFPDDAAFARAAGNRWTEVIGGAIGAEDWAAVQYPDPIPDDLPLGYGAARAADGSHAVLAAAANVDGLIVVEVLDVMPAWGAADRIGAWVGARKPAVDRTGPSAVLADDLGADRILPMTTRDVTAACATITDSLPTRAIRFRPHAALTGAVRVAAKRSVGDGGWVWSRSSAVAPIAALEAATQAVYALSHQPAPVLVELYTRS